MRVGYKRALVALIGKKKALAGSKLFEPSYDVGASPSDISSAVQGRDDWKSHGGAKTHDVRQRFFERQFRTFMDAVPLPKGPGDSVTSGVFIAAEVEYQSKIRQCEVSANAATERTSFFGNQPILVLQN